jgi:hypothetical protein
MRAIMMAAVSGILAAWTVCGQDGAIDNMADLRKSLAAAKTAADHARLASYYYRAARSYNQKENEEEQIAGRWQQQYGNWSKTPNPYRNAMNLAGYYRQLGNDALAHAREQDKLAGAVTDSGH